MSSKNIVSLTLEKLFRISLLHFQAQDESAMPFRRSV
jgi:hypothetical protein